VEGKKYYLIHGDYAMCIIGKLHGRHWQMKGLDFKKTTLISQIQCRTPNGIKLLMNLVTYSRALIDYLASVLNCRSSNNIFIINLSL
jgi:hypothetical protein